MQEVGHGRLGRRCRLLPVLEFRVRPVAVPQVLGRRGAPEPRPGGGCPEAGGGAGPRHLDCHSYRRVGWGGCGEMAKQVTQLSLWAPRPKSVPTPVGFFFSGDANSLSELFSMLRRCSFLEDPRGGAASFG